MTRRRKQRRTRESVIPAPLSLLSDSSAPCQDEVDGRCLREVSDPAETRQCHSVSACCGSLTTTSDHVCKESFHGIDIAAIAKHFPDTASALCLGLSHLWEGLRGDNYRQISPLHDDSLTRDKVVCAAIWSPKLRSHSSHGS